MQTTMSRTSSIDYVCLGAVFAVLMYLWVQ